MIYPIRLYGDSILRKKADDIIEGNPDIKKLSDDMFDTMARADGIGLAGPQIGLSKRIFVVDGTTLEERDMKIYRKRKEGSSIKILAKEYNLSTRTIHRAMRRIEKYNLVI